MIDGFTVVAQIVNFLILVALLWYFLYAPIVAAMTKREEAIAARFAEAEQTKALVERQLREAEEENLRLREERDRRLAAVRDAVEAYRKELTAQVRAEADQLRLRWTEAIRDESEAFLRELRRRIAEATISIARRALSDLAGDAWERCILEAFLERLDRLTPGEQQELAQAVSTGNRQTVVQTAFEPPPDLQAALTATLRRRLGEDLDVRFERSADLACGVALHTNSHKIAWELGDYLHGLEQQIRQMLDEEIAVKTAHRGKT